MPDCECIKGCPYFNNEILQEIDIVLELRKQKYCRGDKTICARYMVFKALGKRVVPPTLLPSQIEEAEAIIRNHKAET